MPKHAASPQSYDDCFFSSKPSPERHPDRAFILATLCGLIGEEPKAPRILEIGCSTGANLISLAFSAPSAELFGIDTSLRQIEVATRTASELQLSNVRFSCLDVGQLTESHGNFDIIICHGVFSWVPATVQDSILKVCNQRLSERGIAFISFNSQPGWNLRGAIGAWLRRCPQPSANADGVTTAKGYLELLKQIQVDDYSPSGIVVRDAINQLLEQSPALFTHEVLSSLSSSHSLADFLAMAQEHNLRFMADSAINHLLFLSNQELGFDEGLSEGLRSLNLTHELKEQLWDLLYPRTLRKIFLCRSAAPMKIRRQIPDSWFISAPLMATSSSYSASDNRAILFESARSGSIEVTEPLIKVALSTLARAWPFPMTMAQLYSEIKKELSRTPGSISTHQDALSNALFPLWLKGYVELSLTPPRFTLTPSDCPRAHPFARLQSNSQAWVCNYRQEYVVLNNIERSILRLLDGSRTRDALHMAMHALYQSREIVLTASDEEVEAAGGLQLVLKNLLSETLETFARAALIANDN